ncbi:MAG TPA: hypothetical protein VEQ65_01685, partial [Opitutus sp.]|nr:hypothetical protein [Opitutus sp.]
MKTPFCLRACLSVFLASVGLWSVGSGAVAAPVDEVYRLGPDSEPQPGVPQGTVSDWAQLPSE